MVMKTDEPWAKLLDQRNIGDFRRWKGHDAYQQAFDRVLRDLKARVMLLGRPQPQPDAKPAPSPASPLVVAGR
jgi:hypothetical protein